MKNQTNQDLSQGTLKALALMQFNNEPFFIIHPDNADSVAYAHDEKEAREMFQEYEADYKENGHKYTAKESHTFEQWCGNNLAEVEPYADDYNNDYLVLTDEEADEKAAEYIKDSVWAFNSGFIIQHSSALDFDDASEQVIRAIADQCERGNAAMSKLIDDMDEFIEDAISADGRGHFMSSYDGNENEETIEGQTFYIYRIN